jgi:hypothetical protein
MMPKTPKRVYSIGPVYHWFMASRDTIISLDTIYANPDPEHIPAHDRPEDFAPAEYRQLVIMRRVNETGVNYILLVNQGWWDAVGTEPKHNRPVAEMPFSTYEELEAAYKAQLKTLISQGYVYAYVPPAPFIESNEKQIKFRVLKSGGTE